MTDKDATDKPKSVMPVRRGNKPKFRVKFTATINAGESITITRKKLHGRDVDVIEAPPGTKIEGLE